MIIEPKRWLTCLALAVAGVSGCTSDDSASDLPVELRGYFHLDGVDAINLRLACDGTFRWTIEGCDFGGGDEGDWSLGATGVVLTSDDDALHWVDGITFMLEVAEVELQRQDEHLAATVRPTTGPTFQQTWPSGAVCPECGGSLGPTGQFACDDPFGSGDGCAE